MSFKEKLGIDEIDYRIILLKQKDPKLTSGLIAKSLNVKKNIVESRLLKLERRKLLNISAGVDFRYTDLKFARIQLKTNDSRDLWNMLSKCPLVSNVYKTTGEYNLAIEILAPSVKTVELVVDECIRSEESVYEINTQFYIDAAKQTVLPLLDNIERIPKQGCHRFCKNNPNSAPP